MDVARQNVTESKYSKSCEMKSHRNKLETLKCTWAGANIKSEYLLNKSKKSLIYQNVISLSRYLSEKPLKGSYFVIHQAIDLNKPQ